MKLLRHIYTISIALFALAISATWAQTDFPKKLSLNYAFQLGGIPLGEVEKRFSFNHGVYTADSQIKPNAAAALLYSGEITEISTFKIKNKQMLPLSFHAVRKGNKPYDRQAQFDYKSKTVKYNSGQSEALRDNSYDLGSFPFAFILENIKQIKNKVFQINTGDQYRPYIALAPSQENIETPAGNYNTTKITLKRQDRDNRFYHVWLDNKTQYPVKIVRDKKGKKSTLLLTKVSD